MAPYRSESFEDGYVKIIGPPPSLIIRMADVEKMLLVGRQTHDKPTISQI